MATNIKDKEKKVIYATLFQRSIATGVDILIVVVIRFLFMATLGELWLKNEIAKFQEDFALKFGGEFFQQNPEHVQYFMNHKIFIYTIIFYSLVILLGACYYAYFHSSNWQATIGKRLMKIILIKNNNLPISFKRGLLYYFLSILPYIYVAYMVSFALKYNFTIVNAISANFFNILATLLFICWTQSYYFTKRKTTMYDLICNTNVIEGKIDQKFPWKKQN